MDDALANQMIGLLGVADTNRGDLQARLPAGLTKGFEPMRLLCVVEQFPETVLEVIDRLDAAQSRSVGRRSVGRRSVALWLLNEWVHLVVIDPVSRELRVLKNRKMITYKSAPRIVVEDAVH
ncbi:hypothetical protein D3C87_1680460 [compost metagenome]